MMTNEKCLSLVCHQFRTTLSVLYSVIQNLHEEAHEALSPDQSEMVVTAYRSIGRTSHLIDRLSKLEELQSRERVVQNSAVDLLSLIEDRVSQLKASGLGTMLDIQILACEDLPKMEADPDLLSELVDNLLDNAVRFARTEIVIELQVIARYIFLSIRDDGPGFDSKFDFFHRGANIGLGLVICKTIIGLHGGKIWMVPAPEEGTEARLLLPIRNEN